MTPHEKTRQQVEKILWREYNPDFSPNMEEVSEEIVSLVRLATLEEVKEMIRDWPREGCGHTDKQHDDPEYDCPGWSTEAEKNRNVLLDQIDFKLTDLLANKGKE